MGCKPNTHLPLRQYMQVHTPIVHTPVLHTPIVHTATVHTPIVRTSAYIFFREKITEGAKRRAGGEGENIKDNTTVLLSTEWLPPPTYIASTITC